MLSVRKYTMAYDSSHENMGSWRVWMTLKDITLKEICQRYNDIVQSGPAMKTRNTECQKQRPEGTWGVSSGQR